MVKHNDAKYAKLGLAAMLPGMVHAHEILGELIEDVRLRLGEAEAPAAATARKRGRPKAAGLTAKGTPVKSGYWAKLTPNERRTEMQKRFAKRAKAKSGQPTQQKQAWDRLPKAERQRRIEKMLKARRAKQSAWVKGKAPVKGITVRMARETQQANGAAVV